MLASVRKYTLKDALEMLKEEDYLTTGHDLKEMGDYIGNSKYYLVDDKFYAVKDVENILNKAHLDECFNQFDTQVELLDGILYMLSLRRKDVNNASFTSNELNQAFEIKHVLKIVSTKYMGFLDVEKEKAFLDGLRNDTNALKRISIDINLKGE